MVTEPKEERVVTIFLTCERRVSVRMQGKARSGCGFAPVGGRRSED